MLQDFRDRYSAGLAGTFLMSRLILMSRIIPERITPELDDADVEARIERAIDKLLKDRNAK
jgi:hypothetical protein